MPIFEYFYEIKYCILFFSTLKKESQTQNGVK